MYQRGMQQPQRLFLGCQRGLDLRPRLQQPRDLVLRDLLGGVRSVREQAVQDLHLVQSPRRGALALFLWAEEKQIRKGSFTNNVDTEGVREF